MKEHFHSLPIQNMNIIFIRTSSSVVLVNKSFVPSEKVNATLIRVENAYEAFASLLQLVDQARPRKKGIHPTAIIEPTAKIGSDVYIGPYAYIGENCIIGDGCSIYPHVYIGDNTKLGNNCTINPGVKIYHDCHYRRRLYHSCRNSDRQ